MTLYGGEKFYSSAFLFVSYGSKCEINGVRILLFQTHNHECRVISTRIYRNFDDNMDTMVYIECLRDYFIAVEYF